MEEQKLRMEQEGDLSLMLGELLESGDISNPRAHISILTKALEGEVSSEISDKIRFKLSVLHFIIQEFDLAKKYLITVPKSSYSKRLHEACKKFGPLKNEEEILSDEDLAEMINYLSHSQRLIIPSIFFEHMQRRSKLNRNPENYWPLAKAMLTIVNNYWNTDPLERELIPVYGGYSLDLSKTRYRIFRCRRGKETFNILGPLKLKKLNLSYTPFFEFWQISGMKLDEINLTGCWIREIHLRNLRAFQSMKLKKIIIDGALYNESSIKALQNEFTVEGINLP